MQRFPGSSLAKAGAGYRSQLLRRFCTPKDSTASSLLQKARVSYKPLILYSAGIGLIGALVGSFYTRTKIAVKQKVESQKNDDGKPDNNAIDQTAEAGTDSKDDAASKTQDEQTSASNSEPQVTLFHKVFEANSIPFKLEEQPIDDSLREPKKLMNEDSIVILVPPVEDLEFLTTIRELVADIYILHKQLHESRGDSTTALKIKYCKMKNIQDLHSFEDISGIKLMDDQNLPVMVVFNKLRLKPQVITLDTVLQEQDKFYGSFRPMMQVHQSNTKRLVQNIHQMLDDEVMLLRMAPEASADEFPEAQKELYEVLQSDQASHFKRVQFLYVKSQDWLQEVFPSLAKQAANEAPAETATPDATAAPEGFKLQPGQYYILHRKSAETWLNKPASDESQAWMTAGDFAIYPVTPEPREFTPETVLFAAGEEYYRRNVVSHSELPGQKPQYSLELAYDANKLSTSQHARVLQIFKKVRSLLDRASDGEKVIKLRIYPKTFDRSEGRNIRLQFRDNQLTELRVKYMMETKTIEEREALLKQHPDLPTNDTTELQYPEGFGFSADDILKFIDLALEKKLPDTPYGELPPTYTRFSRKVVGDSFSRQVLKSPAAQVLFLGSDSCASCKKFTPMYEELAKDNMSKGFELLGKPTVFNHMNKDFNDFPVGKNYLSTPIILLWRQDLKSHPFQYRSGYLTRDSLLSFLQVSQEYSVLPEDNISGLLETVKRFNKPLIN